MMTKQEVSQALCSEVLTLDLYIKRLQLWKYALNQVHVHLDADDVTLSQWIEFMDKKCKGIRNSFYWNYHLWQLPGAPFYEPDKPCSRAYEDLSNLLHEKQARFTEIEEACKKYFTLSSKGTLRKYSAPVN